MPICGYTYARPIRYLNGKPYYIDVSYPDIKKAGGIQVHHDDDRAAITSSTIINKNVNRKAISNEQEKDIQQAFNKRKVLSS